MTNNSSLDPQEIEKFEKISDEWWSQTGKFAILHKFNFCRIAYIKDKIKENFSLASDDLSKLSVLDVGCGGGLLAEPLAQLGADVTAIDASVKNINVAKIHAQKQGLSINYMQSLIEDMPKRKKYDVIMVMEVIEHVDNPKQFINNCSKLLKKNGIMFTATINRTLKSLMLAKFAAEYILRWLPMGTHDWNKFLKPSEIVDFLNEQEGIKYQDLIGAKYNILNDSWFKSKDVSQNYILMFKKV
ncbi:MAG: bifunctional 2-polyprenyl-6-hydroxyphenol methylase/3-demethylubiquinol 3-O-methyltransferase UbiG [Rickettsiales bacterium]|nr:bifunctional 2-polyprenyl-6-hydroxyphenol methylase/3-demethylubiquinol 3-O-methyltransferase UbiG [Rickettsiales bacterium]